MQRGHNSYPEQIGSLVEDSMNQYPQRHKPYIPMLAQSREPQLILIHILSLQA